MQIEFQSRTALRRGGADLGAHADATAWLSIEGTTDEVAAFRRDVMPDLEAIGWSASRMRQATWRPRGTDGVSLGKDGNTCQDQFKHLWTKDEKPKFIREARAVLRKHGIVAPYRRLTLADMM